MNDDPTTPMHDIGAIAADALAALDNGAQIAPFSDRIPDFDLAAAYRVTAELRRLRSARGERPVGRKIGFTNRNIWPEFGVYAPIWGDMYDTTLIEQGPDDTRFDLAAFREPKIEPEIAFGLISAPEPGMSEVALLSCIGWTAQGFEIVQSVFPGWRFQAADTVAAFAMHGGFILGPRVALPRTVPASWRAALADFSVTLLRNGEAVETGSASDVLGGPLSALRHLVGLLADDPANPPLAPGEIVTTGTLTRAIDVAPGEHWQTRIEGMSLPDLSLRLI